MRRSRRKISLLGIVFTVAMLVKSHQTANIIMSGISIFQNIMVDSFVEPINEAVTIVLTN